MKRAILSAIFSLLLGCSAAFLFLFETERFVLWGLGWEFWGLVAIASGIALGLALPFRTERPLPEQNDDEFKQFVKEYKQALKGHLKISILFWSYFYKKEKVKTLEEAKKEVFQDLKKEFPSSMEPLLEEIRNDLQKYK